MFMCSSSNISSRNVVAQGPVLGARAHRQCTLICYVMMQSVNTIHIITGDDTKGNDDIRSPNPIKLQDFCCIVGKDNNKSMRLIR